MERTCQVTKGCLRGEEGGSKEKVTSAESRPKKEIDQRPRCCRSESIFVNRQVVPISWAWDGWMDEAKAAKWPRHGTKKDRRSGSAGLGNIIAMRRKR